MNDKTWFAVRKGNGITTWIQPMYTYSQENPKAHIQESNRNTPEFAVLYGPAPRTEIVQFLSDLDPDWERKKFDALGLLWVYILFPECRDGDQTG